jgi:hypothetical protein
MRTAILAAASAAAALTLTLFDSTPAEAAKSRHVVVRKAPARAVVRQSVKPQTLRHAKKHHSPKLNVEKKIITKTPLVGTGSAAAFVKKSGPQLKFKGLPITPTIASTSLRAGRLAMPQNVKPKLTLAKAPKAQFQYRLAPFVQRHWKKAFFWVAVAGFGYLTIPEIYYDRFYSYVRDDDYDSCINLLSLAALEEEEEIVRVRQPMPASAVYRYSASVAPEPASSGPACSFDPFIERNWSRAYVWVQLPTIGNVTVPEEYYDRFYGFVGAAPPNYPAACTVLVEAAAADTVATTSFDFQRPEFR